MGRKKWDFQRCKIWNKIFESGVSTHPQSCDQGMSLPNPADVASWSLLWTGSWVLDLAHKSICVGHVCINLLKLIISVIRKNRMGAPWALSIIRKTQVNNMASWFLPHFEGKIKRHNHSFRHLWAVYRYCSWDEILIHRGVLYLYVQLTVMEMLCFL